jgi:hypothetical protein
MLCSLAAVRAAQDPSIDVVILASSDSGTSFLLRTRFVAFRVQLVGDPHPCQALSA